MKTIITDLSELHARAAQEIAALIRQKPAASVAFSPCAEQEGVFRELVRLFERGELSLSEAHLFTMRELCGMELCRSSLTEKLLRRTDAREENCFFLSEENFEDCEARIASLGGLDLAVPDLGGNGRIGFNEPATPFDSLTHRQKLAPATRRELASFFGGEENVPEFGVTMGIKTVTSAKAILLPASGEERAKSVFDMLYARTDSAVPAAFLQIPLNVTVYLDSGAAKKL